MKIGVLSCSILAVFVIASAEISTSIDRDFNPSYGDLNGDSDDAYYRKFKVKLPKILKKHHTLWKESSKTNGEENSKRIDETKRHEVSWEGKNEITTSAKSYNNESKILQILKNEGKENAMERTNGKYSTEMNSLKDHLEKRPKREILSNLRLININSTNYYEQRKAVMDKFYARQREINKKYKVRQNGLTSQILTTSTASPYTKNCTNATLSGSLPPKVRTKITRATGNTNERLVWGKCEGQVAYNHNLNLHVVGSSNLDTLFEVTHDKICIACVNVTRQNDAEVSFSLEFGGRGHSNVKLKLTSTKDQDISFNIAIWGVPKTDDDCSNMQ